MRTILLTVCSLIAMQALSQTTVDKAADKVAGTLYQAEKAKNTFNKIKGWLPKKKQKPADSAKVVDIKPIPIDTVKANKTIINITRIDFTRLKMLNDNIKACQGVTASTMKFGTDASTIEVSHTGTTEDLYTILSTMSKDVFSDKNIISLETGKIAIKL